MLLLCCYCAVLLLLPTRHMFCFDCINDAVRATKKCPKCRKTITLKAIKRLYPN